MVAHRTTSDGQPLPAEAGRHAPDQHTLAPSAPSFVGLQRLPSIATADAPITGKLSFSAPIRIDGPLRGEVRSTALVVVGEHGSVEGTLRAREVVILGVVRGEVHATVRVEVGPGGKIIGRIETRALLVAESGVVDASCLIKTER